MSQDLASERRRVANHASRITDLEKQVNHNHTTDVLVRHERWLCDVAWRVDPIHNELIVHQGRTEVLENNADDDDRRIRAVENLLPEEAGLRSKDERIVALGKCNPETCTEEQHDAVDEPVPTQEAGSDGPLADHKDALVGEAAELKGYVAGYTDAYYKYADDFMTQRPMHEVKVEAYAEYTKNVDRKECDCPPGDCLPDACWQSQPEKMAEARLTACQQTVGILEKQSNDLQEQYEKEKERADHESNQVLHGRVASWRDKYNQAQKERDKMATTAKAQAEQIHQQEIVIKRLERDLEHARSERERAQAHSNHWREEFKVAEKERAKLATELNDVNEKAMTALRDALGKK